MMTKDRLPTDVLKSVRSRVAVLLGGPSAEREISLQSGESVCHALRRGGHQVRQIDPTVAPVASVNWNEFDLAFIALHGTYGEDGTLQQELDDQGVLYTGSGARASQLAFDKQRSKSVFLSKRLPTPRWRSLPEGIAEAETHRFARELGFPVVVKPVAQGSSLGVSIVHAERELLPALERARAYGGQVFLEAAIAGEEWTVPILDHEILPPIRIHTEQQFFDFTAKYESDDTRYEVRRCETDETARTVGRLALQAVLALGCRGISRVDLRVDQRGGPWLLEVNTVPGLTDHSLVPKSVASLGWSMTDLCEQMMHSANRMENRIVSRRGSEELPGDAQDRAA